MPVVGAGRTERIEYNSSNAITSWVRYEIDGLQVLRVDEKYDSNSSSTITSADGWRIRDRRTHSPALLGGLLFKEVFTYPSATSSANAESKVYYYGYDKQGNVSVVTEEYCGGTAEKFIFTQDAFGNELEHGVFERSSWSDAAEAGITEHQTGKDLDQFTGLYYFGARWYDPAVGRFISRGVLPPDVESPYLYCQNNPVNLGDIDGYLPRDLEILQNVSNSINGLASGITFGLYDTTRFGLADPSLVEKNTRCYGYGYYSGMGATAGVATSGLALSYGGVMAAGGGAAGLGAGGIVGTGIPTALPFLDPNRLVLVSRWGRPGLRSQDFVMKGGVNLSNYARSFKWEPCWWGRGNQFAAFSTGKPHLVPRSTLHFPHGWEKFKLIFGQRIYIGPPKP